LISGESGNGQTGNVIIIVVSSLSGALVLAVVIAMIIFISRRRTKNQRRRKDQKKLREGRSNLYEMSKAYSETYGNVKYTNLIFISLISSGAFGEVWKGNYRGDIVAIKKMKLEKMPQDQLKFIQLVLTEAKIMRDMQHERVVQFIGFDFRQVSIIMELMPCGALSSFIKEKKKSMKWSTRYQMMLDICEGVAYLHSSTDADGSEKNVLFHQDLKGANILLAEIEGSIRAKISDFGLSCKL
jgi:serine/threonine protein kinase